MRHKLICVACSQQDIFTANDKSPSHRTHNGPAHCIAFDWNLPIRILVPHHRTNTAIEKKNYRQSQFTKFAVVFRIHSSLIFDNLANRLTHRPITHTLALFASLSLPNVPASYTHITCNRIHAVYRVMRIALTALLFTTTESLLFSFIGMHTHTQTHTQHENAVKVTYMLRLQFEHR